MKKRKDIHYSLSNIKYTEKVEIRLSIFMATFFFFSETEKYVQGIIEKLEF